MNNAMKVLKQKMFLPADEIIFWQTFPSILFQSRRECRRISIRDLLSDADQLRRESESLFSDRDPPVVRIAGVVEQSQSRIRRSSDSPHPKLVRTESLRDLVLLGGGDLVRVVVSDSHEVVQQFRQKHFGLG